MAKVIDELGFIKRQVNKDLYSALVNSIIGQQISTKAADTVRARFLELVGDITIDNVAKIEEETIQKCGMSMRKASYIKNISSTKFSEGVNFKNLAELSNKEFKKELMKIKGVGEWTAEMLLIHSLERPDVLSYKDLGIRRAIINLYGLEELSQKDFQKYQENFSPYGTVAAIYLWEISANY